MSHDPLSQWYESYGALVHRRCRALLGSDADANDALQETFLRAHRSPKEGVMQPLPWLYAIATRYCFDQLTSRRRSAAVGDGVLGRLKDLLGLADASASSVEDKLSLGSVLVTLDDTTRTIALLHWLDGFTQEEVAQQTGYSRKTVGVKLRDAEAKLRGLLGDASPEVAV